MVWQTCQWRILPAFHGAPASRNWQSTNQGIFPAISGGNYLEPSEKSEEGRRRCTERRRYWYVQLISVRRLTSDARAPSTKRLIGSARNSPMQLNPQTLNRE